MTRPRLGILVSGRGSNMESIASSVEAGTIAAELALVACNVPGAAAIDKARARGISVVVSDHRGLTREEHDNRMHAALTAADVDYVCLAGYMRLLSASFVAAWQGRMVNIHPSLLPAFPGVHPQAQAVAHGVRLSGCTVHFVDEQLDHGPIILQEAVHVLPDDTEMSLSERILSVEHRLYPEAVALLVDGRLRIDGRRVVIS
jgi:phosphoribosylglycinamide formyltransferase-1